MYEIVKRKISMSAKNPPDNPEKPKRKRISEAEHLANIRAAYLAKLRHPKRRDHPRALAQLRPTPRHNLPSIRRQCSTTRKDGGKCRAPAVRGSDLCWTHGGRLEAPQARGNIKRLLDGRQEERAASADAKRRILEAPPEAVAAVSAIAATCDNPATWPACNINRAQGIEAWTEAQRGAPARWHAWIKAQPGVKAALEARPRPPLAPKGWTKPEGMN